MGRGVGKNLLFGARRPGPGPVKPPLRDTRPLERGIEMAEVLRAVTTEARPIESGDVVYWFASLSLEEKPQILDTERVGIGVTAQGLVAARVSQAQPVGF